jgi:hypothetical protein
MSSGANQALQSVLGSHTLDGIGLGARIDDVKVRWGPPEQVGAMRRGRHRYAWGSVEIFTNDLHQVEMLVVCFVSLQLPAAAGIAAVCEALSTLCEEDLVALCELQPPLGVWDQRTYGDGTVEIVLSREDPGEPFVLHKIVLSKLPSW